MIFVFCWGTNKSRENFSLHNSITGGGGGHVLSAEVNIFSYVCPCHIFSKWQNSLYSEKVENVSEYMENTTNLTVSGGFKNVPGPQMNVVFSLALWLPICGPVNFNSEISEPPPPPSLSWVGTFPEGFFL